MKCISYTVSFLNLCIATAWLTSATSKIHSWPLLVGSMHKTSSLFLASGEECSATPKMENSMSSLSEIPKSLSRKPKAGDIVTFTLHRFEPTNNQVEPLFDTSGTLQLVLHSGHFIPSLHSLIASMTPGETVKSAIIDAGYGPNRPELKLTIPTSQIGDVDTSLVRIGTELALGDIECRITSITDDTWTCDANHPFAGAEYDVDITLESVEDGIKDWGLIESENEGVNGRYETATFALGCFWGGELAYQRMAGVISTHVGYTQGHVANPTYEAVCTGKTGHTEAIRVVYNPSVVSYAKLVQLGIDRLGDNIYKLNQVGNDKGSQYRHGIYYHNDKQKAIALELLARVDVSNNAEVMTEVKRAAEFYMAEDYHQQYLMKGGQSAKTGATETIRCYG